MFYHGRLFAEKGEDLNLTTMCSQRTKRTDATWDLLRAYFSLRLLDRATNTGSTDNNKALRTGLQGLRRCKFPTQCGRLPPELQHIHFGAGGGNFGANFRLGAGKQVHTGIIILQTKSMVSGA